MPTYAVGDVQGCYRALERLLDHIGFDPRRDCLWFVGDLVNRGPDSLAVLRFVKSLGSSAVAVLGNHDLHLLAVFSGILPRRAKDTFHDVLDAPDADDLIAWLRRRPLLHRDQGFTLIHAGLLPHWTTDEAAAYADEVADALRDGRLQDVLRAVYDEKIREQWSPQLAGVDRLEVVINAFTRLRVCSPDGRMNLAFSKTRAEIPDGYLPWFQVPGRRSADTTVIFGHWAALGLHVEDTVIGLDSGCVWGRALTAMRLEDRTVFQVPCESRS